MFDSKIAMVVVNPDLPNPVTVKIFDEDSDVEYRTDLKLTNGGDFEPGEFQFTESMRNLVEHMLETPCRLIGYSFDEDSDRDVTLFKLKVPGDDFSLVIVYGYNHPEQGYVNEYAIMDTLTSTVTTFEYTGRMF